MVLVTIGYLEKYIAKVFRVLGADNSYVDINVIDSDECYAGARGITIFNDSYGKIYLTRGIINKLNLDELKFVIIHEAVHIYKNHLPIKLASESLRELIRIYGLRNPIFSIASIIADGINLIKYEAGRLPAEAEITKEQELQADIWGIIILGDESIAINCLKKLADYNLDRPSHLWEVLGVKMPVMTVKERINEIVKRASILKREGIL